ncbi:hypothetical protein KA062_00615 [Patescibacteria group bacterium]|nr:hypothetical protein [Patescibacteria group bacterium]
MIEFVNAFMTSSISPFLKILIILFFVGGALYNIVSGVLFISSLVFDYQDKKRLRELDKYVDPPTFR